MTLCDLDEVSGKGKKENLISQHNLFLMNLAAYDDTNTTTNTTTTTTTTTTTNNNNSIF